MSTAKRPALLTGLALVMLLVLPRFAPQVALAEAACGRRDLHLAALRGDQAGGDWLVYRNARDGLSFRYPPSMQVVDVDAVKLGIVRDTDAPPEVVDLRGNGIIVRFICATGEKTPEMAADMAQRLRRQAKNPSALTSIQIDGHEAFAASVRGGGGSCLWDITILQPRSCSIFPMGTGLGNSDDSSPPLHDGNYPLLSVIKTVHFADVPSN